MRFRTSRTLRATGLLMCLSPVFHDLVFADESAIDDALLPCEESEDVQDRGLGDFWGSGSGSAGGLWKSPGDAGYPEAECVPAEDLLFSRRAEKRRSTNTGRQRLTFTARGDRDDSRTVLRQSGREGGFSHAVEVRNDTLARKRLVWDQRAARHDNAERGTRGWRLAAGDMSDTALRLWPRALPRRTLPAGWRAARGTSAEPLLASAPVPHGFAAGVFGNDFGAYALRATNPVTRTGETPWARPFVLRHDAAGAHLALAGTANDATDDAASRPWRLSLHASHTRIARGGFPASPSLPAYGDTTMDSASPVFPVTGDAGRALSERVFAAEVTSPRRGLELVAALADNDRADHARAAASKRGVLLGADMYTAVTHPRAGRADLDFTMRGRSAGWASAWDPALTAAQLDKRFGADDAGGTEDFAARHAWGAHEARAALEWTSPARAPGGHPESARLETWRTGNPEAATTRSGARVDVRWRLEDARLALTALRRVRVSRTARTIAHAVRADGAQTRFPRARILAWRAWNADGSRDAGLKLGVEPDWSLTTRAGDKLTITVDPELGGEWTEGKPRADGRDPAQSVEAVAGLSVRVRARSGWSVETTAEAPLGRNVNAGVRWSLALSAHH